MGNENIEEILPDATEIPLESEENNPVSETDVLPDTEVMEDVPASTEDVPADENNTDTPILEESETETIPETENTSETTPETLPESENASETLPESETTSEIEIAEKENGEMTNEEIVEMENGNEDFYSSVSDNDAVVDGSGSSSAGNIYNVTNVYEIVEEESPGLWKSNISEFSSTDMLLFLIFILLLVQFIHNLFKGSHWFKG